MEERFVISVLSANRVGIFSDVAAVVAGFGGNIDGLSQTVTEGYFTMLLTATFALENKNSDDFRREMTQELQANVDGVMVLPYRSKSVAEPPSAYRYIITLIGTDHAGLLAQVTKALEEKNINVTDWYFEFDDHTVTHIGEIVVPRDLDIKGLQEELAQTLSGMDLSCRIQHDNIFRVTNEIGRIKSLVEESRRA